MEAIIQDKMRLNKCNAYTTKEILVGENPMCQQQEKQKKEKKNKGRQKKKQAYR